MDELHQAVDRGWTVSLSSKDGYGYKVRMQQEDDIREAYFNDFSRVPGFVKDMI